MNISNLSRRFWAYFFDSLTVAGLYAGVLVLLKLLGVQIQLQGVLERNHNDLSTFYMTYCLFYTLYEVIFLYSGLSATPGKLIMGLEVVCYNNGNIIKIITRALIKSIASVITFVPVIFFFVAVFSKKKQSPHDMLAQTVVVKKENSSSDEVTSSLYEEMQKRGVKTYSEQLALAKEMNVPERRQASAKSHSWIGLLLLILSIVFSSIFTVMSVPEFSKYARNLPVSIPKHKLHGVEVDESIANPYLGTWVTSDKKIGYRMHYDEKTGMMYVNTSIRGLKFRFDSDDTLYITDPNNYEFKTVLNSENSITMTTPIDKRLELRYRLSKVE
jgi:uncharacterized RDD family membrane protein YckC